MTRVSITGCRSETALVWGVETLRASRAPVRRAAYNSPHNRNAPARLESPGARHQEASPDAVQA